MTWNTLALSYAPDLGSGWKIVPSYGLRDSFCFCLLFSLSVRVCVLSGPLTLMLADVICQALRYYYRYDFNISISQKHSKQWQFEKICNCALTCTLNNSHTSRTWIGCINALQSRIESKQKYVYNSRKKNCVNSSTFSLCAHFRL